MADLEAMIRAIVRDELQRADLSAAPTRAVTVREAAARLSVHPKTIRRLLQSGELRGIRVGHRSLRIRMSDIVALLASEESQR